VIDGTNGYPVIGGENVKSYEKTRVLTVPNEGFSVDGILSVLNASGSGFTDWKIDDSKNGGYPYPDGISF